MLVFATVGLIVRHIPLPESIIAFCRAFWALFLFIFACAKGEAAREKLWEHRYKLFACVFAMGLNWIFLFKAFASTTVAAAVICYYMASIFVLFFRLLVLGNN